VLGASLGHLGLEIEDLPGRAAWVDDCASL